MATKPKATIEDLYHMPDNGKAEIVNGELVQMPPAGDMPSRAGLNVTVSLREYERHARAGRVYPDNTGFRVNLPHRASFSPDASFYTGTHTGMRFLEGAPISAVEIRSENGYGLTAERALAEKRADYFAADTLVVWDVDLLSLDTIRVYRATDPDHPTIYQRGGSCRGRASVAWLADAGR